MFCVVLCNIIKSEIRDYKLSAHLNYFKLKPHNSNLKTLLAVHAQQELLVIVGTLHAVFQEFHRFD